MLTILHRLFRPVTARAKTFAGWMIFRSGIYRRLLRGRAVIVAFHRIDDSYRRDPITCSSQEFEEFIRFFARFFDVIPLTEMLERVANGSEIGSTLTITFDDGYRCSATIAAPILEGHGLRACFFVTTEFIGSDWVPHWDGSRGIQTNWMTWDQVRGLRAAGHEIGSHTATHVDLGVVVGEEARSEIAGGSKRLDAELSESSGLFAYPFGGRRHLADENRSLPKELGLRCNVSAHGGTVRSGDDPFALKRTPINHWFVSPYQFGFELVMGHLEQD